MIAHGSILYAQRRTALFGVGAMASSSILFIVSAAGYRVFQGVSIDVIATALFIGPFAILSVSLRCPSCRLRLFWYAVSKHTANHWLKWLLSTTKCPRCGYVQPKFHT